MIDGFITFIISVVCDLILMWPSAGWVWDQGFESSLKLSFETPRRSLGVYHLSWKDVFNTLIQKTHFCDANKYGVGWICLEEGFHAKGGKEVQIWIVPVSTQLHGLSKYYWPHRDTFTSLWAELYSPLPWETEVGGKKCVEPKFGDFVEVF